MAIICPKLPHSRYYNHIFTTSHKDTTLNRCSKDKTILAIINVYISSNIEDKIHSTFTFIDIKLLTFQRIDWLDFKLVLLLFEAVICRVKFFLLHTCIENIVFGFGFLLDYFRLRLDLWLFLLFNGLTILLFMLYYLWFNLVFLLK